MISWLNPITYKFSAKYSYIAPYFTVWNKKEQWLIGNWRKSDNRFIKNKMLKIFSTIKFQGFPHKFTELVTRFK